jgi:uncharacterized membrane protein YciS (DUF1049 family)
MRIKTIIIILITVVFTIVLMQNTGPVTFSFLWADFRISKLAMLVMVAAVAFILGWLVGRPNKVKRLGGDYPDENTEHTNPNTLSDEDRDYIS